MLYIATILVKVSLAIYIYDTENGGFVNLYAFNYLTYFCVKHYSGMLQTFHSNVKCVIIFLVRASFFALPPKYSVYNWVEMVVT